MDLLSLKHPGFPELHWMRNTFSIITLDYQASRDLFSSLSGLFRPFLPILRLFHSRLTLDATVYGEYSNPGACAKIAFYVFQAVVAVKGFLERTAVATHLHHATFLQILTICRSGSWARVWGAWFPWHRKKRTPPAFPILTAHAFGPLQRWNPRPACCRPLHDRFSPAHYHRIVDRQATLFTPFSTRKLNAPA